MFRPLRLKVLLAAAVVIVFIITSNQISSRHSRLAIFPSPYPPPPPPLSVAVLESEGCHDEVTAALVYAFAQQPLTNVTLYLKKARFGIQPIYHSFFSSGRPGADAPVRATSRDFSPRNLQQAAPHVVVMVTGDRRITFLTLSPHVHHYLLKTITPTWKTLIDVPPRIETFVPVFPVDPALSSATAFNLGAEEIGFAIQGNASPGRRNYTKVVLQLAELRRHKTAPDVRLHLLSGSSAIEQVAIPAEVAEHVVVHRSLDYADYYRLLGQNVALLTAFESNAYYYERASSTIPAALISGTPVIADQRLLDAYSYLDRSLVWFREPGEEEMDVAVKVARETSAEERRARSAQVRRKNRDLCRANVQMIASWVRETANT
ncbi:uncharacterized protein ACA1_129930 [Acanthamoeba castellanii str. Neff]|uniref:Glycosyltransferase n=1 Tax=Acanthamoeba castellanii (strain ATCC 30010 / Neff) TaxID=1257118 RepID=L8GQA6_ACACF|nr:uncharacterized protein ACA1_129930 [Acanthamoeba castellanii str. Neff]ELR14838.1 hypothetical protein ACA1_129930 [Acanthamoeba castellanii str. Neff]